MKYKEVILGTMMIGAMLSPVSAKAKMPTGMKIYTLHTLMSGAKKAREAQNSKPEEPVKTAQPVKEEPVRPQNKEEKRKSQNLVFGVLGASIVLLACWGVHDWYTHKYRKARGKER